MWKMCCWGSHLVYAQSWDDMINNYLSAICCMWYTNILVDLTPDLVMVHWISALEKQQCFYVPFCDYRCFTEDGCGRKCWLLTWTLLVTCTVIPLFTLSLVSFEYKVLFCYLMQALHILIYVYRGFHIVWNAQCRDIARLCECVCT